MSCKHFTKELSAVKTISLFWISSSESWRQISVHQKRVQVITFLLYLFGFDKIEEGETEVEPCVFLDIRRFARQFQKRFEGIKSLWEVESLIGTQGCWKGCRWKSWWHSGRSTSYGLYVAVKVIFGAQRTFLLGYLKIIFGMGLFGPQWRGPSRILKTRIVN